MNEAQIRVSQFYPFVCHTSLTGLCGHRTFSPRPSVPSRKSPSTSTRPAGPRASLLSYSCDVVMARMRSTSTTIASSTGVSTSSPIHSPSPFPLRTSQLGDRLCVRHPWPLISVRWCASSTTAFELSGLAVTFRPTTIVTCPCRVDLEDPRPACIAAVTGAPSARVLPEKFPSPPLMPLWLWDLGLINQGVQRLEASDALLLAVTCTIRLFLWSRWCWAYYVPSHWTQGNKLGVRLLTSTPYPTQTTANDATPHRVR